MKVIASINDAPLEVDLRVDPEHEGGFIATVGEREVYLEIIERKPTSLTLAINGQVGFYEYHHEAGRLSEVIHDCRSFKASLKNPQQEQLEKLLAEFGAGLGGTSSQAVIIAPMPGKILGVSVKLGEQLELGQVVAVLEAMKMENEITSTVEGKVRSIRVRVGDTVNVGDPLIETDPLD
jgi:biotin carboxyl carrier protein